MGTFNHEAACVDPGGGHVYMTEDKPDGGLYRFTPTRYPDLSDGRLEVLLADGGFAPVPDPSGITAATRHQVAGMKHFNGGEGIWFDSGHVYFSTKGDNRVWDLDVAHGPPDRPLRRRQPARRASTTSRSRARASSTCARTAATWRSA